VLWAFLGTSLDEIGRQQAAVFALETALFAKPDYGWAWGRLGKVHGFAPAVLWQDMGESAAEVRDTASFERACRELRRLDPALARKLRRKGRAMAPPPVAPAAASGAVPRNVL
jgi:hypothetical protein